MPRGYKENSWGFFFFCFLLKFKTRKCHNALFSSAEAQHTSAKQQCLFAYSLADSVQNNLGIVTDVIRKMIKQTLFPSIVRSFTPSPAGWGNTGTVVASPSYTKMFISRRVW